jgi:hypothetical protein
MCATTWCSTSRTKYIATLCPLSGESKNHQGKDECRTFEMEVMWKINVTKKGKCAVCDEKTSGYAICMPWQDRIILTG